ncbi:MAG: DNA internalization-related competence protein ComEC/Rec2 [Oscillospiraceae bacterium]|jgi:competence protein ComEC|nr:DNA internalization-related competence protein ComEC/Rec2 [Oscillospiraceae bacterium]
MDNAVTDWLRRHYKGLIAAAAIAAACIAWKFGFDAIFYAPARSLDGASSDFTVRVLDYTRVYDDAGITPVSIMRSGADIKADLYIYYHGEAPRTLEPGAIVGVTASAVLASSREYDKTSAGVFVYLRASSDEVEQIRDAGFSVRYLPRYIARHLSEVADRVFTPGSAPFMKALLIGDRFDWNADKYVKSAFAIAGLSHVVAVSGMHIGFLTALLSLLLGRVRLRAIVGLPVIAVFVLITGANAPAVRAGIMSAGFLVTPLSESDYKPWRALPGSFLLLYASNPYSVAGPSLQLSYAAVIGILLFSKKLAGRPNHNASRLRKLLYALRSAAALSIAANAFTLPLAVYHFGYVSLIFLPANLLALWAVEAAFVVGAPALAVGAIAASVGAAIAYVPSLLTRYVTGVAVAISKIPFAAVYVRSAYITFWCVYIAILAVTLALAKQRIRRKPAVFAGLALVTLAVALAFNRLDVPGGLSVIALDVGQGQCSVFMSRDATVVVDCGGTALGDEGDLAADYLASRGRYSIDALILTHFHADHAAGVPELLRRIAVKRLVVPMLSGDEYGELAREIFAVASETGVTVRYVADTCTETLSGMSLTLFPPLAAEGTNERGLTVLTESGRFKAFVCGDMDSETELRLTEFTQLPDIDVLLVGHHGSRYSSSELFLSIMRPEVALISVGARNTYGHPSGETLLRLANSGAKVFRTDMSGTVEVRVGG